MAWIYDENGELIAKRDGQSLVYAKFAGFVINKDFSLVKPLQVEGITVGYIENGNIHPALVDRRESLIGKNSLEHIPSAYGEQVQQSGSTELWSFAQTVRDEDFGLLRMGARFYDPEAGLFVSPDLYFIEKMDYCIESPVECNIFSYAKNNPLQYVDLTGKFVITLGVSFDIKALAGASIERAAAIGVDARPGVPLF